MIAAAGAVYLFSRRSGLPQQAALPNTTFTQLTDQAGPEYFPSLSPDGKSFVYAAFAAGNWDIYFQRVGGKNPINLTKDSPADDTQPAFSPDGERIAFRSEREGGGIFLMGATGESVKRLTDFGYDPAWSSDGKEIACADEGILTPAIRTHKSLLSAVNVATERSVRSLTLMGCNPTGLRTDIGLLIRADGIKHNEISGPFPLVVASRSR
jgi:Tol biopolymer transport system component